MSVRPQTGDMPYLKYNIPPALGRDPIMLVFWAILGPALFLYGSALIGLTVTPAFEPGTGAERAAYQTAWLFNCLGMAAWFAAMTLWSEQIGAGTFAGPVNLPRHWLTLSLCAGPLILFIPNFILDGLMSSDQWAYRNEVNTDALGPGNWSLTFIFLAVVMAPVAEELAFRGIVLGGLVARGASPVLAALLSSAAFALIHLHYTLAGMAVVFIAGLGFAALRLIGASLMVPILAHASGNAFILWLNWMAQGG